jgi:hypothetical protein
LSSNIISSRYYEASPGNQNNKIVTIYDKKGNQLFNIIVNYKVDTIIKSLEEHIARVTLEESSKAKQLETINSNSFWSYRRILPYTLNILFTENFNPKTPIAQIIYFIHNLVVLVFLLSFITTLLQNYITKYSDPT